MTIPQAIAELGDRGVPEVVQMLRVLSWELRDRNAKIADLQRQIDELKYGEF